MSNEQLNAWEYSNGNWTRITDPCNSFIDELDGNVDDGLRKAGYDSQGYVGHEDVILSFEIFTANDTRGDIPQKYPYLLCINDTCYTHLNVYCASFHDYLALSQLCASSTTLALLTELITTYENAINIIIKPYQDQYERGERERIRKRNREKGIS